MKQYTVIVKEGEHSWEEKHGVPDNLDPEETIRTIIERFNKYNRRNYVFVKLVRKRKGETRRTHDWTKQSLVTEKSGFDKMKCLNCGATGKRYGMGQNGTRADAEFDNIYCKE